VLREAENDLRSGVAMPPPTEQGFQQAHSSRVVRSTPVAMPPPTEQGFQRGGRAPDAPIRGRNAPSNRTRVSTLNNDNYLYLSVIVAMPPPTEQGFQHHSNDVGREEWGVAMPPPTEQGFQHKRLKGHLHPPGSQCPLQQNKDFNPDHPGEWVSHWSQCPLQQNKDFN